MKILKAFLLFILISAMLGMLKRTAAGMYNPAVSVMTIGLVIFAGVKLRKWNPRKF